MKIRIHIEIVSVVLIMMLMFALVGCSSKEEKYEYEGERVNYLVLQTTLNTSPFISEDEFDEQADEIIDNIESYKTETKEGKAVKKSVLELRKKEKEFYLEYLYNDEKKKMPNIEEVLKKYYDDLDEKVEKFNEKFIKVLGEDASWY